MVGAGSIFVFSKEEMVECLPSLALLPRVSPRLNCRQLTLMKRSGDIQYVGQNCTPFIEIHELTLWG